MKEAAILHGTNGDPNKKGWQKWLKQELESAGYNVFFPHLPDSYRPDLEKYDAFLRDSGWDFTDNLVIAHSSGTTELLHLLAQDWFPKLRATVLVGTFLNEKKLQGAGWYEPGMFDRLFVEEFDPTAIGQKSGAVYCVHGDDDPYCDYNNARELCEKLHGTFVTVPGGGHLSSSSRADGFPELVATLKKGGLL